MRIREFADADLLALKRMHAAQGFDYPFPEIADPIFLVKLVVEDAASHPVMASLLRLTSEAYLLHDPQAGTPLQRWERFLMLHEATRREALRWGLQDVHCWVPPQVARQKEGGQARQEGRAGFGRRLLRLGWERPLWVDFVHEL